MMLNRSSLQLHIIDFLDKGRETGLFSIPFYPFDIFYRDKQLELYDNSK